ncbi:MAG: DNA-processing protein DprA [Desulfobacterales bacterium]
MKHLIPWFELKHVPGIGNLLYKRLIDRFGSPEAVFGASYEDLCQIEGISKKTALAVIRRHSKTDVTAYLRRVIDRGIHLVTMTDPHYPRLLLEIPDPPPYLYVFGTPEVLSENLAIAVVGSRNATAYGMAAARRLCSELAARGVVIISGMARGIDTAAHDGAIQAGGKTAAVLGSGFDRIYPRENRKLFHAISENGAVFSEFELSAGPEARHFPARNRIISGMSMGCVVVEATEKSGSLITARLAAEQNREVFAVPGSIHSENSAGTHGLIKQGAKLVAGIDDILEEFEQWINEKSISENTVMDRLAEPLSPDEHQVVRHMGHYPSHIDDIMRKTALEPGKLSGILLRLEMLGIVSQSPGKFFSLSV